LGIRERRQPLRQIHPARARRPLNRRTAQVARARGPSRSGRCMQAGISSRARLEAHLQEIQDSADPRRMEIAPALANRGENHWTVDSPTDSSFGPWETAKAVDKLL